MHAYDTDGRTTMKAACCEMLVELVRYILLIKKQNIHVANNECYGHAYTASKSGHSEIVQLLNHVGEYIFVVYNKQTSDRLEWCLLEGSCVSSKELEVQEAGTISLSVLIGMLLVFIYVSWLISSSSFFHRGLTLPRVPGSFNERLLVLPTN